ncbi:GAP family protein [Rhabdothermincola salaria]|uniref:GAP family protein n=1 Tax=Rhabdothermincola salaria TaxID=2903142 RepID=UPI001E3B206E|nr:GAP family protein [Rhabdothermincola salaria]MCD9622696.1 GAP family protein [Rhabdothermincola salaria]
MTVDAIADLLPTAMAVALSPFPVVAVVMVLAGPRARSAGPTFAVGWVVGLSVVSVLVVLVAGGASDPDSDVATGVNWLQMALAVALFTMAGRQWRKRPAPGSTPEMPGWMAGIDAMGPGRALVLGLALSAANPKNLVLTLAAAASIAQAGLEADGEALAVAAFVAIASLSVVGSVVFSLVAPAPASRSLRSVRRFMTDHNAAIMTVVLLLLGAKVLGNGLSGLSG